jgi:hypothetical protein
MLICPSNRDNSYGGRMKLTVSQTIVLGLVIILVLCVLILWAALRKPLEHKKVSAMSSLGVQAKNGA